MLGKGGREEGREKEVQEDVREGGTDSKDPLLQRGEQRGEDTLA